YSLGQFPPAVLAIAHPRRNGLAGRKLSCPNTDGSLWGEFADASYCLPAAPESDPASTRGAFRTCHRAWERYQGQALYDILRCRNCGGSIEKVRPCAECVRR